MFQIKSVFVLLLCFLHADASQEIIRIVSFTNDITQETAICGETVKNRLWISINAEPGTERQISLEFVSNKDWAQIQASSSEFTNEVFWKEYVKRVQLRVSLDLILKVPGCEPSTNTAITIQGIYKGGICDEEKTDCRLSLPDSSITFTTQPPRIGTLIASPFNVICDQWTNPIKLMIPNRLLEPEILYITPKSLLQNALTFRSSLIEADTNPIQFSYLHPYFPKSTYMYVKAKDDLALSQKLEIEYIMKCLECKFNQFPEKIQQPYPAIVAESSKQKFVPLFIPTMKLWHKYCFTLTLNRKPIIVVGVTFELCGEMIIEPREVLFSKEKDDSRHEKFCITPIEEKQCELKFYLTGQATHQYLKPTQITVYSKEEEQMKIIFPTTIETTNRIISTPQVVKVQKGAYINVVLIPISTEIEFFKFSPEYFELNSEIMESNQIEFYVTPNVDCPMKDEESNNSMYYVIEWRINGSLDNYKKPSPIYIKVLANSDELTSEERWCDDEIDCSNPKIGMTCFPDICVINITNPSCQSLYVKSITKQSGFTLLQYGILICAFVMVVFIILKKCGCIGGVKIPDTTDTDEEIEEKKIFNTKENFEEAQVAIENLLWQLYEHEKNLDINKKYKRDVHKNNYYDD